ncbi:ribosome small subunit-dependent GTPase A [Pelagibacterium luteolum]|uniref:Small ribosomal subunit biogenesis GTPase RsgA n=1 Tax=Pelagibacterium luteolum TaxID=440168 RepID=A0A1G7WTH2_9HYPH|nr:ribosome small subunit-dependent GTPase A [Pelagibacterium luteolum]SDG74580.1 ribosome biogenesis GTPase [Pelagibacterium luteolum]
MGFDRALESLGWSSFFDDQVESDDAELVPARIDAVHRGRMSGLTTGGKVRIGFEGRTDTGGYAVGDWVLIEAGSGIFRRLLDRKSLLQRASDGKWPTQLVAANVDTLFIVAACNADFSPPRIERYLALANEAGTDPVIVLTKADTAENAAEMGRQAEALQRELPVLVLNGRTRAATEALMPWCGAGATVALVGSSGVGKSTLVNGLIGEGAGARQETGDMAAGEAKGRHVTTSRSLHKIAGGGWVIDTPGMRSVYVKDIGQGIDTLFAEITELAPECKFRNCTHDHEPGCAVRAAVKAGTIDADRLERWRKLQAESAPKARW